MRHYTTINTGLKTPKQTCVEGLMKIIQLCIRSVQIQVWASLGRGAAAWGGTVREDFSRRPVPVVLGQCSAQGSAPWRGLEQCLAFMGSLLNIFVQEHCLNAQPGLVCCGGC